MKSNLVKSLACAGALALGSIPANAAIITVEATGTIYSGIDHTGVTGIEGSLTGRSLTATWTFDTENVPADRNTNPEYGAYDYYYTSDYSDINWINTTFSLTGLDESFDESDYTDNDNVDNEFDSVYIHNTSNHDHYYIRSQDREWARNTNLYFNSYAYFRDYSDLDTLLSDAIDQTFSWTDSGANDHGRGYFQVNDNANREYAWARYSLNSMRAYVVNDVPEPATLALLGLGLASLGIARRKQKA